MRSLGGAAHTHPTLPDGVILLSCSSIPAFTRRARSHLLLVDHHHPLLPALSPPPPRARLSLHPCPLSFYAGLSVQF